MIGFSQNGTTRLNRMAHNTVQLIFGQDLNELLHAILIPGKQIDRIHFINDRIRTLEIDPDFGKTLPELERLYDDLRLLKESLNLAMQEPLSSEQLEKLHKNMYLLSEMNHRITQATSATERDEEAILYAREAFALIAGDPTIPPSLVHIIRQSYSRLGSYIYKIDDHTYNFKRIADHNNMETWQDILENLKRISQGMHLINKFLGNNPDEIPFDDPISLRQYRRQHFSRLHLWTSISYDWKTNLAVVEYNKRDLSEKKEDNKKLMLETYHEFETEFRNLSKLNRFEVGAQEPSSCTSEYVISLINIEFFLKLIEESRV